jgi:hypothetical protein
MSDEPDSGAVHAFGSFQLRESLSLVNVSPVAEGVDDPDRRVTC